jgi:hypothetical protein
MARKQTQSVVATTPIIKARNTVEALIPEGHVHHDQYVRFDDDQSLTSPDIDQFLINLNTPLNGEGVILRLDGVQDLTSTSKVRGRNNLGIIDDINLTTPEGDLNLSALVTNAGDLVGSVVRYDQAQTISDEQAAQFAENSKAISSSPNLSTQTISTSLNVNGSQMNVPNGPVTSKGVTATGTLHTTNIVTTVKIADPENENLQSAIHVTVANNTNAYAMNAGGAWIVNLKTPTEATPNYAATVEFVTNQIVGLDLEGNYLRLDGTNALAGSVSFATNTSNFTLKNLGKPVAQKDAQRASTMITYIGADGNSSILTASDLTAESGSSSVAPASNQTYFVNYGTWNGGDADPINPSQGRGMIVRQGMPSGLYRVAVHASSSAASLSLGIGGKFASGSTTNLNPTYEQSLSQAASGDTRISIFEFYIPITDGVLNIHRAVNIDSIQKIAATRISETTATAVYKGTTLVSGQVPV